MGIYVGSRFSTSNSTVAKLPKGATLRVTAQGELEITSIPVREFKEGDRINTKYGLAKVVALSSRFDEIVPFNPQTEVLYVADGTSKVRKALKSAVSFA